MTLPVQTNQRMTVSVFLSNVPLQAPRMGLLCQPSHHPGGDKHASPRNVSSEIMSCGSEQWFRGPAPWAHGVGFYGVNAVKTTGKSLPLPLFKLNCLWEGVRTVCTGRRDEDWVEQTDQMLSSSIHVALGSVSLHGFVDEQSRFWHCIQVCWECNISWKWTILYKITSLLGMPSIGFAHVPASLLDGMCLLLSCFPRRRSEGSCCCPLCRASYFQPSNQLQPETW